MMIIGLLKEKMPETRVALTPETVKTLIQQKVEVAFEHGAGDHSFFRDQDFEQAGAKPYGRDEVFSRADCIVTVGPLPPEEVAAWGNEKILIGTLDPYNGESLIRQLVKNRITSFSLELLPRTSLAQSMDVLSSMATVSGYRAVLEAAMHLPRFFPMFMTAAGTIKPAKVLILGAGVAGLQAIATARRLGAVVEVFDVRSAVKEEVHSLGAKFIEVEGAVEDKGAGGYAVEQAGDFKARQGELIQKHAEKADVVICTAQIPGKKAPILLQRKTVEAMQPGSVVIDLAASSGGNCELSRNNEHVVHHGVTIIGRSNYPVSLQLDASRMYSNNLTNFTRLLIDPDGDLKLNWNDEIVKNTCLTHDGAIVHEKFKLPDQHS